MQLMDESQPMSPLFWRWYHRELPQRGCQMQQTFQGGRESISAITSTFRIQNPRSRGKAYIERKISTWVTCQSCQWIGQRRGLKSCSESTQNKPNVKTIGARRPVQKVPGGWKNHTQVCTCQGWNKDKSRTTYEKVGEGQGFENLGKQV